MLQTYFLVAFFLVGGEELIITKDPSLSVHGYQLLPIATSYVVGNNRNFDISGIF